MKLKPVLFTVALLLLGASVCLASDVSVGTWKRNDAKSKMNPKAPKNDTVKIEQAAGNMKITVDGTDADGKPAHNEWTGKYDGKDYALTGDPAADMRSYARVNDRTLTLTQKKNGKVTTTGKVTISADGKTRTVTTDSTDAKGNKIHNVAVYDKQ